jgi:regulator of protease activity HflC (stomatin/prohibitin superfamily)
VLEAVLVRNVVLPSQIEAAITDKLEAEQSALKMKYVIAQQEATDQKSLEALADSPNAKLVLMGSAAAGKTVLDLRGADR